MGEWDQLVPDPHLAELLRLLYLFDPADRDPRNFHSSLALLLAREGLRLDQQTRTVLFSLALHRSDLVEDVLSVGDVGKLVKALGHRFTGEFFSFVADRFNESCVSRRLYLRGRTIVMPKERKQRRSEWLALTAPHRQDLLQDVVTLALQAGPDAPLEWVWDLAETRPL